MVITPNRVLIVLSLAAALSLLPLLPAEANHAAFQIQRANGLTIILSSSAEGVFADEQTSLRLQFYALPTAPATTPALVSPKMLRCSITMPSMRGMPAIHPTPAKVGTGGMYDIKVNFPHGGTYSVGFSFAPPGQTKPVRIEYPLNVQDYEATVDPKRQPFSLALNTIPNAVTAGNATRLTLRVLSRETKQPVRTFEIVHEKKMHLIAVHRGLRYFYHLHPEWHPDGTFTLPFTFPAAGDWQLFAEVAPPNVGVRPLSVALKVRPGNVTLPAPNRVTQNADSAACITDQVTANGATTAGLTLTLRSPVPMAHSTSPLDFTLTDRSGKPITNIPPWLGAPAHLVAIHEDVETFVHSHPSDRTPAAVSAGKLNFLARFPKPGTYRCWVQIRQKQNILTFPLSVRVTKRAALRAAR